MKKNENVILSNDIEIIDGIEVDWSRYRGKDNNRARKSYIGLCELLQRKGHILESNYINNTTKIHINYNCGHKPHSITPSNYKTGYGCPKCGFERIVELKIEKSKQDLYNLAKKNNHTILGEYIDAKTPILIDFNCGHKPHSITPDNYKNGKSCPVCAGVSFEYAKEKLYKIANERGHKILSEYKGVEKEILIDFNCGHKPHSTTPRVYKQGCGCPICKSSKGEVEVARVLKDMNINYEEQYRFEGCRCVLPLPFDFYISEFNLCIEYDGTHHYEPVAYYKKEYSENKKMRAKIAAEERLKKTQRRDKIKTDYCKNNGINLIRIPYWEFDNIEKILKKELSKYIQAVA